MTLRNILCLIQFIFLLKNGYCDFKFLSVCNQDHLTLKLCELYQLEFQDQDDHSKHEKIKKKYELAYLLHSNSNSTSSQYNGEKISFVEDIIKLFQPPRVNLFHKNILLHKYLMRKMIFVSNIIPSNNLRTRNNYKGSDLTMIYKTSSRLKNWVKQVLDWTYFQVGYTIESVDNTKYYIDTIIVLGAGREQFMISTRRIHSIRLWIILNDSTRLT